MVLKLENVGNLRTSPSVNTLIVVAYYADIWGIAACEVSYELQLQPIRILKFVDHQIPEF